MQELISIIVPVYNVEHYLIECLDSIVNQSYKNLEIILIDDGSTDTSGKICDYFKEIDKRIKVFHTLNKGLSAARNLGLDNATGKYIGFVDSDDVVDCDMYGLLHSAMMRYEAQIAECKIIRGKNVSAHTFTKGKKRIFCYTGREAAERNLYPDLLRIHPDFAVYSKLYKKEIILDLRFPEGKIHEDYLFTCQALMRCQKYCYVDSGLYFYRMRQGSITHTSFNERDMDRLFIIRERTEFLKKSGENTLARISQAHEYLLLFAYFYQAKKYNMEIANDFAKELYENKVQIIKSKISLKRKLVYMIFYINPLLYMFIMDFIKKGRK